MAKHGQRIRPDQLKEAWVNSARLHANRNASPRLKVDTFQLLPKLGEITTKQRHVNRLQKRLQLLIARLRAQRSKVVHMRHFLLWCTEKRGDAARDQFSAERKFIVL